MFAYVLLYLNPARDPKRMPGGELVLGGTDPNYYTGSFHYVDNKEEGKWEVNMKG